MLRFLRLLLDASSSNVRSVVCVVHADALASLSPDAESQDYHSLHLYARASISLESPGQVVPYGGDVSILGGAFTVSMTSTSSSSQQQQQVFMIDRGGNSNRKVLTYGPCPTLRITTRARRVNAKLQTAEEWFALEPCGDDGWGRLLLLPCEDYEIVKRRQEAMQAPDPTQGSTFNLRISETEKVAKDAVQLPYTHHLPPSAPPTAQLYKPSENASATITANSTIYVEPEDIFDDEDPDADLDL